MSGTYSALAALLAAGETVAVATITEVKGSVPREVGTKMIIHPLGQHQGTVGGGCGEADVIRAAMDVLQSGEPANVRVDLTDAITLQALGVCGGVMNVFVERWGGETGRDELNALVQSIDDQTPVALATVIRSAEAQARIDSGEGTSKVGRRLLVWLDRPALGHLDLGAMEERIQAEIADVLRNGRHQTLRYAEPDLEIFVEVQRRSPQLIIVGAGHIAVPLCELGAMCEFGVTVIDDRIQFANPQRFPKAARVIAADMRASIGEWAHGEDTYVVLVTRGHTLDTECLLEILDRPLAYIGMIGSQRRVRAVFDLLERTQGIAREKLARVYAPIGLPIAAQTPAEIAVAIMGEIINVRRQGSAPSLADGRRGR